MTDDREIGELIRQAADRAADSMPRKYPGPDFFDRVGRTSETPRRYVVYVAAAAAAVLAIVFSIALFRDAGPAGVDTVSPPSTGPTATVSTTVPEAVDQIAIQLAADRETANALGLAIGELVYAADGTITLEGQPDLIPLVLDGELIGYSKPAEILDLQAGTDRVYAPDGVTVRGLIDSAGVYLPAEDS